MEIKTICLGVLSLGEASGYEIKKFFEDGFSHFYVAGFGSIYPALAQLTRDGHVTCSNVEQEKRPAKKVYRITDSGVVQFRHELAQGYPSHRVRSDFLLQMVFADFLPQSRLDEVLTLRSQDLQQELQHISDYRKCEGLPQGGLFALGYAQAVLQAGYDYIEKNRLTLLAQTEEKEL
jgi:PadR family transcriptional regulator AphA